MFFYFVLDFLIKNWKLFILTSILKYKFMLLYLTKTYSLCLHKDRTTFALIFAYAPQFCQNYPQNKTVFYIHSDQWDLQTGVSDRL